MAVLPTIPYPPPQLRLRGANKSGVQAPERDFAVCETWLTRAVNFCPRKARFGTRFPQRMRANRKIGLLKDRLVKSRPVEGQSPSGRPKTCFGHPLLQRSSVSHCICKCYPVAAPVGKLETFVTKAFYHLQ